MRTALTIGREPDNDLVINLPIVSGHHARLTWEGVPGQALLEDLGSSNGTAVGQLDRKVTRATIRQGETVYFGNHPMAAADLLGWVDPSLAPGLIFLGAEMFVGRDPSCQRVFDRPSISSRHARLRRNGSDIVLEDLGSSNGTFVNGRRVEGPTVVRPGDLIGLGVETFRLATSAPTVASTQRMDAIRPPITPQPLPTIAIDRNVPVAQAQVSSSASTWVHLAALMALLLQAPLLGILIGVLSGGPVSALSLLSLAALWLGLSAAVVGLMLDPRRLEAGANPGFWLSRSAILGAICVVGTALASLAIASLVGLKGSTGSMIGLASLASLVGLAVGSVIVLVAPSPSLAWGGLAVALVGLALLGGGPASLPRTAGLVNLASNVSPSRWAFEGLLVTEAQVRQAPAPALGGDNGDLAEAYFPAATDRMGPKADATALVAMLVGLFGVGAFLVGSTSETSR
jgi:pSer/pThr/pTyr-binding forkhead associated (FHA) protein